MITICDHDWNPGKEVDVGTRVELSPGTDRWMRGDPFGSIVSLTPKGLVRVKLDRSGQTLSFRPDLLRVSR